MFRFHTMILFAKNGILTISLSHINSGKKFELISYKCQRYCRQQILLHL